MRSQGGISTSNMIQFLLVASTSRNWSNCHAFLLVASTSNMIQFPLVASTSRMDQFLLVALGGRVRVRWRVRSGGRGEMFSLKINVLTFRKQRFWSILQDFLAKVGPFSFKNERFGLEKTTILENSSDFLANRPFSFKNERFGL